MKSLQQLEAEWSYDEAVNRLIPMVTNWKKKTLEVARELYIANKKLSNQGRRSDLKELTSAKSGRSLEEKTLTCGNFATDSDGKKYATSFLQEESSNVIKPKVFHSFLEFCDTIGISYSTAFHWLVLYDPDKDYLLTTEEYKIEKSKELEDFYEGVRKKRKKDPSYVPAREDINLKWNRNIVAWTESVSKRYEGWLYAKENGGKKEPVSKLDVILSTVDSRAEEIGEYGLFGTEALNELAKKCMAKVSPSDFLDLTKKYEKRIPRGVNVRDILRIPVIVKAELDGMDIYQRKETVRVLVEIISKLGLEDK